jgi:hypothetical protein
MRTVVHQSPYNCVWINLDDFIGVHCSQRFKQLEPIEHPNLVGVGHAAEFATISIVYLAALKDVPPCCFVGRLKG